MDEFGERVTGAARIIDIADEKHPFVVSNLRLKVNQPEVYDQLQGDPGNGGTSRGYQAHYCTVPSRVDPNIVACCSSCRDCGSSTSERWRSPRRSPTSTTPTLAGDGPLNTGAFGMSAPAYDPVTKDIWYADGNAGLFVVRLQGAARIPFAGSYFSPGS